MSVNKSSYVKCQNKCNFRDQFGGKGTLKETVYLHQGMCASLKYLMRAKGCSCIIKHKIKSTKSILNIFIHSLKGKVVWPESSLSSVEKHH